MPAKTHHCLKNKRSLICAFIVTLAITGCQLYHEMTYEEFIPRLQRGCAKYDLLRDLSPEVQKQTCDCIVKTTQKNWPDMQSLLAAISVQYRAPRGEGDYVPSVVRITFEACSQTKR